MAYCTAANVKVYTGTTVLDADLTAMISDSDDEINQFFVTRGGLTPSSTAAKAASILLTRSKIAERFHNTGENPTAWSSGDYAQSGVADQKGLADSLHSEAEKVMRDELGRLQSGYTDSASTRRSDAVVDDFQLAQSDIPESFSELPS
jgi:hypothetical protein